MVELSTQEVAEDYRRQLQEAAARRTGLDGFEGRDPVVWFDMHKESLALEAREAGGTAEEVDEVLAEMRANIAASPSGTRFDDPFGRMILRRLVGHVQTFCKAKDLPVRGGIAYGLAPIVGLSALQRPVLGTDASIIELSVPLMRFSSEVSRLLSETIGHSPLGDGRWEVSFHPRETFALLSSRPALIDAWIKLLSDYAVFGWPDTYNFNQMSMLGALQTRVQLTRAAQLFAVAHEFGHHVLDHGQSESSEGPTDPIEDEYQADSFAFEAGLHIAKSEAPLNFYMQSGVGGVVLLVASELVARTHAVLARGTVGPSTDNMHPPLASRVKNMTGVEGQLDRQTLMNFRDARACFATILELVWDRALPAIKALHDQGARPAQDL